MEIDFTKYTRPQLAKYLKERDFAASTLTKAQLLDLAEKARDLGVPVVEPDDTANCEADFKKIGDCEIDIPSLNSFSDNLMFLPSLELGDVFVYLLSVCKWPTARLKNRKADDGYELFKERHIDNVKMVEVSES